MWVLAARAGRGRVSHTRRAAEVLALGLPSGLDLAVVDHAVHDKHPQALGEMGRRWLGAGFRSSGFEPLNGCRAGRSHFSEGLRGLS